MRTQTYPGEDCAEIDRYAIAVRLERATTGAAVSGDGVNGDEITRTVSDIDVGPAARPVFAATTSKSGEKRPTFFVRINNSTQELYGQDAHDYQRSRWPV